MSLSVLEQEMSQYFTQLNTEEKKSIVNMIKTFLQTRRQDNNRVTIEQYNKEMEESERQIKDGKFVTHDELDKEMEKW